jgi:hypothetical protein
MLYSRKSFPPSAELDFRGSSKNIANQRFAVFRDQLSYGTIYWVQKYIFFQLKQMKTSPYPPSILYTHLHVCYKK